MERSGLKEGIRGMTFDAFKTETSWQKTVKDGAMKYVSNPEGWLLFCGQSGSGKTHLCTAVSRDRLYAGVAVRYMPWRDKVAELKSLSLDAPRRGEIISAYKNAELLFLDDLFKTGRGSDGAARPTAADIGLAFEIVNHRYINHLPTVVSTELTPQELVGIDEALGSRIIEAAGENVFVISRDINRNYRLRNIQCV
jgi:DNA replication protein DnaC